jgi:hypothetical protein
MLPPPLSDHYCSFPLLVSQSNTSPEPALDPFRPRQNVTSAKKSERLFGQMRVVPIPAALLR